MAASSSAFYVLLLLIALQHDTNAQVLRCSTPKEWEGRAIVYNFMSNQRSTVMVHYDANNLRVAELDIVNAGMPGQKFYERILDYKEKVSYTITKSANRSCIKRAIPPQATFRAFGPPANSVFLQQIEIGSYEENFYANEYSLSPTQHPNQYVYLGTFTSNKCIPVYEINDRNASDIRGSTHAQYYDITLGISNPNVFIPPKNCEDLTGVEGVSLENMFKI
eukprot:m.333192 g.333192  ORF g.333192 m.333192 type:complete len:221 (+) comp17091_c0_seq1:88-750(+)